MKLKFRWFVRTVGAFFFVLMFYAVPGSALQLLLGLLLFVWVVLEMFMIVTPGPKKAVKK
jgi:hypothetical protein